MEITIPETLSSSQNEAARHLLIPASIGSVEDVNAADSHSNGKNGVSVLRTRFAQVQVEMTSHCNLRCRSCLYPLYEDQWIKKNLSATVFEQVLSIAPHCESIHLQGWGETLLRPDVAACIAAVAKAGTRPTLSSNGTLLNRRLAGECIAAGLDSMAFSLSGPDSKSHDAIRGEGTFHAAVAGIRTFARQRLEASKPALLINYLLTPHSFPKLPQALALCAKLGVDTLVATHLVHVCTDDQGGLACYDTKKRYSWVLFRSRLAVLWRRVNLIVPGSRKSPLPVCAKNPLQNAFVAADGAVAPCVYLCPPIKGGFKHKTDRGILTTRRTVMGNLNQNSFFDVWNTPKYTAFRSAFERRVALYESLMPPVRTDFEGLERLEKATARIRKIFEEESFLPPAPCRGCPHLDGY